MNEIRLMKEHKVSKSTLGGERAMPRCTFFNEIGDVLSKVLVKNTLNRRAWKHMMEVNEAKELSGS